MFELIEEQLHWNAFLSPVMTAVLTFLSVAYLFDLYRKGRKFAGVKLYLWEPVFFLALITVLLNVAICLYGIFYHNTFTISVCANILVLAVEYKAFAVFNRILHHIPLK